MNKKMIPVKSFSRIALCALLVLSMLGAMACRLVPEDEVADVTPFTDEELATAVIQIGERTVDLEEYLAIYNEVVSYYSSTYGYDITSSDEDLEEYKKTITDTLVQENMLLYRAAELGLDKLTPEQEQEVEENYQANLDDIYDYYTGLAESDKESDDSINVEEKTEQYVLDDAAYYLGEGATLDEYKEYLKNSARDSYVTDLLRDYISADVTIDDEKIQEFYNTTLSEEDSGDQAYYSAHPESYKTEQESYEQNGTLTDGETAIPPLYIPEGYSRILHIYTTSDADFSDEYAENADKMDELTDEYGKLAIESASTGSNKNSARMREIVDEYKKLKDANGTEWNEKFAAAQTKIDQAYSELKAAGSNVDSSKFAEIMLKYTEDKVITSNDILSASGRLISEYKSSDDWSSEVKNAFSSLKPGQYSNVIQDEDGYHIIFYISDVTPGPVPLDNVKDAISEQLKNEEKENVINDKIAEWMEDSEGVIVINEDLIGKVGKRKSA